MNVAPASGLRLDHHRAVRIVLALWVAQAAAALWLQRDVFRAWEAAVAAYLSGWATASRSAVDLRTDTLFVGLGRPDVFGLRVTPECTAAILAVGFLVIMGITVALSRISVLRVLLAGLAALAVLIAGNQLRLVMIAFAVDHWGPGSGFHWSHMWAGSFVTVFATGAAAAVYLIVLGVRGPRRGGGPGAPQT